MTNPLPNRFSCTALSLLLLLFLTGCSMPRRLKGGHSTTTGPLTQTLTQSDNPSQPSRQDGAGLTECNLSHWKAGGHIDYLRARQLTEAIHARYELAQDIIANSKNGNDAGHAIVQVIAVNLCEFLTETDPVVLRESLLSDADKFTRFVNAMVRLAEGGIKCELHKFHSEDRTIETAKQKKPSDQPGISDEALHAAEAKLKLL